MFPSDLNFSSLKRGNGDWMILSWKDTPDLFLCFTRFWYKGIGWKSSRECGDAELHRLSIYSARAIAIALDYLLRVSKQSWKIYLNLEFGFQILFFLI